MITASVMKELKRESKAIKVLRVKCGPVTGKAKGILMAHSNRCLSEHGDDHYLGNQWIKSIS